MEPTKDRIEKEAVDYSTRIKPLSIRMHHEHGYIAGATSEHERSQQELQAYKDIIKELLPLAEKTFDSIARHEVIYAPNKLYKEEVAEIIDKARKLIDTVTPTSNPEQS